MIRVTLPYHLQILARVGTEVQLDLEKPLSVGNLLDRLEQNYPMLRGTIRDHVSLQRRPMIRFFACSQDISFAPYETPLPTAIISGTEPFMIIGAIAGG